MAAMTNYLENKLIDHLFKATPYTAPAGLYIALFTATPGETGGGTEVTGGSYARVNVAPGTTTGWRPTQGGTNAPSTGTSAMTSNIATITFPTATASWGTITSWGIFDALTVGNLLIYANLTSPLLVNLAYAPSFAVDQLIFQIDS